VISDTHKLVRPEALGALRGCELIVHAGDIGCSAVIEELQRIAPVMAIRGNVDRGAWAEEFPQQRELEIVGRRIYVIHDLKQLPFDPAVSGFDVVISGHSHQPRLYRDGAVLYLNPGSAGPRRFRLPVAVARLEISPAAVAAELHELAV
jgi:putative phosphoesterase